MVVKFILLLLCYHLKPTTITFICFFNDVEQLSYSIMYQPEYPSLYCVSQGYELHHKKVKGAFIVSLGSKSDKGEGLVTTIGRSQNMWGQVLVG